MRATVKVAPTNAGIPSIFVGATFTVALVAQIIYRNENTEGGMLSELKRNMPEITNPTSKY
jgi:predicted secreted protein